GQVRGARPRPGGHRRRGPGEGRAAPATALPRRVGWRVPGDGGGRGPPGEDVRRLAGADRAVPVHGVLLVPRRGGGAGERAGDGGGRGVGAGDRGPELQHLRRSRLHFHPRRGGDERAAVRVRVQPAAGAGPVTRRGAAGGDAADGAAGDDDGAGG